MARLVLLTRPREQSEAAARALARMGHQVLIDPVLEIRPIEAPAPDLSGVAAVALTSAHAASALASLPADLPVFAVGAATARAAARALGRSVVGAAGDGRALAGLIASLLPPSAGAVLHLAGAATSPGLAEELAAAGCAYRRLVVYQAVPTRSLAAEMVDALRRRRIAAVLHYSPRSARLWVESLRQAGLAGELTTVLAACLSEAVAAELTGSAWREVRIAATPDQDALFRCLEAVR